MSNKEKYINFIVNDLVNNTKVDYESNTFTPPQSFSYDLHQSMSISSWLHHIKPKSFFTSTPFVKYLHKHLVKVYGVNNEELEIIVRKYINELITLFSRG